MDVFIAIYHLFLKQPVFNGLIVLAQFVPGKDFGVAVILLTLIVRLVSYPLGAKAVHAQKRFAELQPKIKEVQEKYKDKKQEQSRAMLELYREAKVNPFSSFLPLLIQIPIFIVLYQVFSKGLHEEQFSLLYNFVPAPTNIDPTFLGLIDLNERSILIALLAGALQFVQLKQASPKKQKKNKGGKPDVAQLMQQQMPFIFPALIVWVVASLPAAFGLYIIASTVFSIWQYWFIARKDHHEQATSASN